MYKRQTAYYRKELADNGFDIIPGTHPCVPAVSYTHLDQAVTIRDRDTMEQERVKIDELDTYFAKKFEW